MATLTEIYQEEILLAVNLSGMVMAFLKIRSYSCATFNDPEILGKEIFFISFLAGDFTEDS